jgi:hypothetical protein
MQTLLTSAFILLGFSATLAQTKKDSLYVFVGEKIEVTGIKNPIDTSEVPFDGATRATYKIIQKVFGDLKKDTIVFEAFDHYGIPAFSTYRYALLFVSAYKGKLYHEKYQFFDVYKTTNGRWASSYKARDYHHPYNKNTTVKPEPIPFAEEVSYDIRYAGRDATAELYPAPYYRIEGNKAIAVWGNYIEELFTLKKESILKARGIF